jgi:hypothetical protein
VLADEVDAARGMDDPERLRARGGPGVALDERSSERPRIPGEPLGLGRLAEGHWLSI